MSEVKARERLLVHLSRHDDEISQKLEVSTDLCQQGISEAINVSRAIVVQLIQELKEEGLVKESKKHVKGLKRKRKVYTLQPDGFKEAERVRGRYRERDVTVKDEGVIDEIQLEEIDEFIEGKEAFLKGLNFLDEDGVIDLSKVRRSEKDEDVFVGREEELEEIISLIEDTKASRANLMMVKGETGIGKTRLVMEAKKYAEKLGFDFISGKGVNESTEPYLPLKEAFQEYKEKKSIWPDEGWKGLVFMGGESDRADKSEIFGEDKAKTMQEGVRYLKNISSENPIMIFVDDLHWADKATVNFLSYLRERLSDDPVFFIGAYRSEEMGQEHILRHQVPILKKKKIVKILELGPLKKEHTEEIIIRSLGVKNVPDGFVDLIHEKTEGNPLFISEMITLMDEEGVIDTEEGEYPDDGEDYPIPDLVEKVIDRKLSRLDDETKKVLQLCSVMGNRISFDLLASITDKDEIDLLDHIDSLISANLLYEDPTQEVFRFTHGLITDLVYSDLIDVKKKVFNKKVAENMEGMGEEFIQENLSRLAYHYRRAEMDEKALEYLMKAGRKAMDLYAYEDAIDLYERALELIERSSGEFLDHQKEVLECLGDLYRQTESYGKSLEIFEELSRIAKDDEFEKRLLRKKAYVHLDRREHKKALDLINEGLEEVDKSETEYCRLLEIKGWLLREKGEKESAMVVYEEEKKSGKEHGNEEVYGEAIQELGSVVLPFSEGEDPIEYLLDELRTQGDEGRIPEDALEINESDEEREILERALRIHRISVEAREVSNGPLDRSGMVFDPSGDLLDQAMDLHEKALNNWKEAGKSEGMGVTYFHMGVIHQKKDEEKKAQEAIEKAKNIFSEMKREEWVKKCREILY